MIKIAITGSTGLVGSRIQELLYHDFEFVPLLSHHTDITDSNQVSTFLDKIDYDILLHIAAYTDVDGAERKPEIAKRVNVVGTQNLYKAAQKKDKKFVYISTDFVFDGTTPPYDEDSTPHPLGIYGATKYEGEKIVKGHAMIVRISYPYRSFFEKKLDFIRSLYSYLKDGRQLHMITDSIITPTFIDDIAFSLKHLLSNFSPETFHLVGSESISPFEVAVAIAKKFGFDQKLIKSTSFKEFSKGRAPRPQYSEIKSKKNDFHKMLPLEEGLNKLVFPS